MHEIIWLVAMVAFFAIEATSVTLISLWFAGGSLAALIVSLLGGEFWLQAVVFVVVSLVLLALFRPLVRKFIKPKITATNVDSVIGSQGYTTEQVDNVAATGQVKLGGMFWTARSTDGSPIPPNTLIRVDRVEGVKVYVTPVQETANV